MALSRSIKGNSAVEVTANQEAKKVEAAAVATAPKYEDGVLCSMSDKIAFISPLGDPSRPDTVKDKDGKVTSTPYIVGYRFKALADIEVPECGLDSDARKNLMSFIPENKNNTKQVKAGEEFLLTRFETGLLLAKPEFNCKVTGGGKEFTLAIQSKVVKSKTGDLGKASSATSLPTVALRADTGSLKDYKIEEVLSYTEVTGANGTKTKQRVINPGYEKWEPYCHAPAPKARRSSGGSASSKTKRNASAEAFLALVAKK